MLEGNENLSEAQKDVRARNTFLLALDGDVDFQPDAIVKLVTNITSESRGLVTLLEGVGLVFDIQKGLKFQKIKYGCFKAVKLVKKVIILVYGVPTIYMLARRTSHRSLQALSFECI